MIISMRLHATKPELDAVCERIGEFGYKVHSIVGDERVVIGVVGTGDVTPCLESLEAMPQVEKAVRISAPYKFVSRGVQATQVRDHVGWRGRGRRRVCGDGGAPCSVESEKQIMDTAHFVAEPRRHVSARRRLQAPHVSLRLSRYGTRRP